MLDTDSLIALGNCSKRFFRLVDDQEVWKLLVRRIPKFNLADIQPCRLAESNLKRLTTLLPNFPSQTTRSLGSGGYTRPEPELEQKEGFDLEVNWQALVTFAGWGS